MKSKFNFLIFLCFVSAVSLLAGCRPVKFPAEKSSVIPAQNRDSGIAMTGINFSSAFYADENLDSVIHLLDELAELERAGTWIDGMALTESSIREKAGDYAGAVIAAYKELARAYGKGLIRGDEMEKGVLNVLASGGSSSAVTAAAHAILFFINGNWDDAAFNLRSLFDELDEPDGFARWMILVCDLEKNNADRRACAAYKSIRARYTQFPEYWYRGARVFSGSAKAEFAENCINSSAEGPFAVECRSILAEYSGLNADDGASIKTMLEIESIIYQSVNSGNPAVLDSLMPLVSLPDNSYTVYAVGALRALAGLSGFRDYFSKKAASSGGRLAERLSYICGG